MKKPENSAGEGIGYTYCGQILRGDYSRALKAHVKRAVDTMTAFDRLGSPAIPYISAWKNHQKVMWYEFASKHFLKLMNCTSNELAMIFRKSVIDRRIYRYRGTAEDIHKEVVPSEELHGLRKKIRDEGTETKGVDAVYKIALAEDRILWLKDQAVIEAYPSDGIFLSKGCLTIVTKEMQSEEARERAEKERIQREKLQGVLEMAGAVCHELNQPVMAITCQTDMISMAVPEEDPLQEKLATLKSQAVRVGTITRQLMQITTYKTKDYVGGERIIDIEAASKKGVLE